MKTHNLTLTQEQRDTLISQSHQRLQIIRKHGYTPHIRKEYADTLCDLMRAYPDHTLISMHQYFMLDIDQQEAPAQCSERIDFLEFLIDPQLNDTPETLHEYLTFRSVFPAKAPRLHPEGFHEHMEIIRALHEYPQLPAMENYAHADKSTTAKITTLIQLTSELSHEYYSRHSRAIDEAMQNSKSSTYDDVPVIIPPIELGIPLCMDSTSGELRIRLYGDDLTNLALANPDKAPLIAHYINNENISDPTLLREIVNATTPTLRNGML